MGEIRVFLDNETHGEILRISKVMGLSVSEVAARAIAKGLTSLAHKPGNG
jgi:hypothetical protein